MENLQKRKKEIIEQIGEDGLRKLKFSKILKLIENQILELMSYWTVRQINRMVCESFEINISEPFFYRFCLSLKNLEKDKKSDVGVSQKRDRDIKKDEKSINNIDDLTNSAVDFVTKNLPKK